MITKLPAAIAYTYRADLDNKTLSKYHKTIVLKTEDVEDSAVAPHTWNFL